MKNKSLTFFRQTYFLAFILKLSFVSTLFAQFPTDSKQYILINKATGKALDVKGGVLTADNPIQQFDINHSNAQKFTFVKFNNTRFYNIFTSNNLFVTLLIPPPVVSTGSTTTGQVANSVVYGLMQAVKIKPSTVPIFSPNAPNPNFQVWKLVEMDEPLTFIIQSAAFPDKVLQPYILLSQSAVGLAQQTNADIQKWIISKAQQPHSEDTDIGYGRLDVNFNDHTPWWMNHFFVDAGAGDVSINNGRSNIDKICPQHRSVGEESVLQLPKKSYETLEGIVGAARVSYQDFPSSHYTHDFTFEVTPDPAYHYLLADSLNSNGRRGDSQKHIEVEWETGLAQGNSNGFINTGASGVNVPAFTNPAKSFNNSGNSFGFFSAGHTIQDIIWNWPTSGDRVHIEGIWTWERGHPPAHTEIHPAHFVAVQRKLPVSLVFDANNNPIIRNSPEDKFIATQIDVFASADGNPMFNTKGLNPDFNQIVEMNRKDYSFVVKHPFTKMPSSRTTSSALRCNYIKQKGDNFPNQVEPIIKIISNNEVLITIPWKSKNVPNTAIFARTFVVYWEESGTIVINTKTTKVLEIEKPKLYQINIVKINLLKKMDRTDDPEDEGAATNNKYGNLRIFGNIGNSWLSLNEFADVPNHPNRLNLGNILGSSLGNTLDNNSFLLNRSFNVYVPCTASLPNLKLYGSIPIKFCGWEADGIDALMGNIINEYSRDKEFVSTFFGNRLNFLDNSGGQDENVGNINTTLNPSSIDAEKNPNQQTLHSIYTEKNTAHQVFDIIYTIKELPFSSTFDNNIGIGTKKK